jgi:hypothetical protein
MKLSMIPGHAESHFLMKTNRLEFRGKYNINVWTFSSPFSSPSGLTARGLLLDREDIGAIPTILPQNYQHG